LSFNLTTAFFMLKIPKKSKASLFLGLGFAMMAGHALSMFISTAFYYPMAAYQRWLVPFIIFAIVYFTQFLLSYPERSHPRLARTILYIQLLIAGAFTILYIIKSPASGTIYNFFGHYWTFASYQLNKMLAYLLVLFVVILLGVGLWRFIITKTKERWSVLAILIAMMIVSIIPSLANMSSRQGSLDRGTFQIIFDSLTVLGFFVLFVIYVNNTKDRTTFMAKITGISLVTFLMVFLAVSYFSVKSKENAYNDIHRAKLPHILGTGSTRPPDLQYITAFIPAKNRLKIIYLKPGADVSLNFNKTRPELLNAFLWNIMMHIDAANFRSRLMMLLKQASPHSAGYKLAILNRLQRSKLEKAALKSEMARFIKSMEKPLRVQYIKILRLPETGFRKALAEYLAGQGSLIFQPFRFAILNHMRKSLWQGQALKVEILDFLAPIKAPGSRYLRQHRTKKVHYVSFIQTKDDKVYEIGFSYLKYRQYLHESAFILTIIFLIVFFIVSFGYQFFFKGALLTPLRALMEGTRMVNMGYLDTNITVRVDDEIGFLTRSFNKMIHSINLAKKELKSYSEELEDKVDERTVELKEAKKETDTIMQSVYEGLFLLHYENEKYITGNQYSRALQTILETEDLANKDLLVFLESKVHEKKIKNLISYLELMFQGKVDEDTINELNPLGQERFYFGEENSKTLQFHFARIEEKGKVEHLVVIVRDISKQVQLTEQLKRTEAKAGAQMDQLFNVLHLDPAILTEFLGDMELELNTINHLLKSELKEEEQLEILRAIFRSVHTIKGDAAILNLKSVSTKAHIFEERLVRLGDESDTSKESMQKLYEMYVELSETLHDLRILITQLVNFHKTFGKEKLSAGDLFLKAVAKAIERVGNELGKDVFFMHNEFDQSVIPEKYGKLLRDVFIQLVRNSVFHGIETTSIREELRKKPKGTISISSSMVNNTLELTFRDDGSGIPIEKLKNAAIQSGRYKEKEINSWSEKELEDLMFEPGISTADTTSVSAGRGVGMDAIKNKLEENKGSISVSFMRGKYTEFKILLPEE